MLIEDALSALNQIKYPFIARSYAAFTFVGLAKHRFGFSWHPFGATVGLLIFLFQHRHYQSIEY